MTTLEITIKTAAPVRIAVASKTVPNWDNLGPVVQELYGKVMPFVEKHGLQVTGPSICLYHVVDGVYTAEATMQVDRIVDEENGVSVRDLPEVEVAVGVHKGHFSNIGETHVGVEKWVRDNGYALAGPAREVYVEMDMDADPSTWVTEVQYPIKKA